MYVSKVDANSLSPLRHLLFLLQCHLLPHFLKQKWISIVLNIYQESFGLIPLKTAGQGSCLFRAVSLLLFGNQNFHVQLKVRTIIELVSKNKLFSRSDTLGPRLAAENNFIYGEATNSEPTDPHGLEAEVAYDDDILGLCSGGWSSILSFDSLANALGITITSNLPDIAPGYLKDVLNGPVHPQNGAGKD